MSSCIEIKYSVLPVVAEVLLQVLVEHIEVSQLDAGAHVQRNFLQHGVAHLLVPAVCGRTDSCVSLKDDRRHLMEECRNCRGTFQLV